mmetsp:Transcript_13940/g.37225  ORF Transcript_13940/g.37225 Transcript_13940/m.37225 type:complete len:327 (-) Transcript_13940:116-1096(-)
MAKFLVAVAATAASMVSATDGDTWMYTLSGACDAQGDLNGMPFVKQGTTLSGAPYYKALSAERYVYHDPDCEDGMPRWVIDVSRPDVNKTHDLDGDGNCDYIGRIDSRDTTHPPTSGEWTMLCEDGHYKQQFVVLLEGSTTTTTTLAKGATSTTTTSRNGTQSTTTTKSTSLMLSGTCAYKQALNGLIFDVVSTAADGSPIYKARGVEEYIYHDADCDGAGNVTAARWVVDNSKPNSTATKDLDGDGKCTYHARLDSTGGKMLPTSATWRMYCGEAAGWVSVDLTLKQASDKVPVAGSTVVSSTTRGGIAASVIALSLAIMRALLA